MLLSKDLVDDVVNVPTCANGKVLCTCKALVQEGMVGGLREAEVGEHIVKTHHEGRGWREGERKIHLLFCICCVL